MASAEPTGLSRRYVNAWRPEVMRPQFSSSLNEAKKRRLLSVSCWLGGAA